MEQIKVIKRSTEVTDVIKELTKKSLLIQNMLNTNGYAIDVSNGKKVMVNMIKQTRIDPRVDCIYLITKDKDNIEKGYKLVVLSPWLALIPVKITNIKNKFPIIKMELVSKTVNKSQQQQKSNTNNHQQKRKPNPNNKQHKQQKK